MIGYSHYVSFKTGTDIDRKLIQSFLDECEMFLNQENLPDHVRFFGNTEDSGPLISKDTLYLGIYVPSKYKHREGKPDPLLCISFDPEKNPNRYPIHVITTDKEPYDFVIGAILLSLAYWLKDHVYVTTDGGKKHWKQAISYYRYITERSDTEVFFSK